MKLVWYRGKRGNMRNAIPRECEVVITVPETEVEDVLAFVGECEQVWRDEFATIEEGLSFKAERVELPKYIFLKKSAITW